MAWASRPWPSASWPRAPWPATPVNTLATVDGEGTVHLHVIDHVDGRRSHLIAFG